MEGIKNRKDMLNKAYEDCMRELYARAQPSADYDNIIDEYRQGKIGKEERVYERHYVSKEEYDYVVDKYVKTYGMDKKWFRDVDTVKDWVVNGGPPRRKAVYDKDYEHVEHEYEDRKRFKSEVMEELEKAGLDQKTVNELSDTIQDKVLGQIEDCKHFYRFDREEDDFRGWVALGASPTSNPETVKKWWKENYNQDIEIEDRIPDLFWYYDNGYDDEDLGYEFEHLGEDWKEKLYAEWQEEKRRKKAEADARYEELKAKFNAEQKKDTDNT